jgi:hypothetical protein
MTTMTETGLIVYTGDPRKTGAFDQFLREQGIAATWEPPEEGRSVEQTVETIVLHLLAGGGVVAGFKLAVQKFHKWFPLDEVHFELKIETKTIKFEFGAQSSGRDTDEDEEKIIDDESS